MDMIGRIRRLHVRDKLSEREIARMTGLHLEFCLVRHRFDIQCSSRVSYNRAKLTHACIHSA